MSPTVATRPKRMSPSRASFDALRSSTSISSPVSTSFSRNPRLGSQLITSWKLKGAYEMAAMSAFSVSPIRPFSFSRKKSAGVIPGGRRRGPSTTPGS